MDLWKVFFSLLSPFLFPLIGCKNRSGIMIRRLDKDYS
jgi:hypothetical protein